jgi:hypothetical protein
MSSLNNTFYRFLMSTCHDDNMSSSGLCHHFSFKVSTIHGFKISYNGYIFECLPQCTNAMKPFGKNKRISSFEPVNTCS